jgi:hypothetical protein
VNIFIITVSMGSSQRQPISCGPPVWRLSVVLKRGCWCHITVLNVHDPTEDKIDVVKDNIYKDLEHVFDKFPMPYENFVRRFQFQSR